MSSVAIHELPIPERVGAEGWDDFAEATALHFANEAEIYGSTDIGLTAEEMLPHFQDQENEPTRLFVGRDAGRIVSRGFYEIEAGDDPTTAWLYVDVASSHRRQGLGTEMAAWLEQVAATDRIRKAIVFGPSAPAAGARVDSPTGFGSVPAENPEVRFLRSRDYRLEQVARASRLALPVETTGRLAAAASASGDDYVVHYWIDHTPAGWRDDMADLRQRMSTEEPSAGLESPEDPWSVERLIETEQRLAGGPRDYLTAAVEHVPSGHLIGFTTVSVPAEADRPVAQEDTLVLPDHRGHRLGMLLKVANLDHVQRERPGHPSVITFNAEENRHMLDVNEAVGFVPIGYEGGWRRDLPR